MNPRLLALREGERKYTLVRSELAYLNLRALLKHGGQLDWIGAIICPKNDMRWGDSEITVFSLAKICFANSSPLLFNYFSSTSVIHANIFVR